MEMLPLLKALADDSRLQILRLLLEHDHCVRSLARKLEISESAVSQHLKVLRAVGLLTGEKRGHFTHYTVDRTVLHALARELDLLADGIEAPIPPAHSRSCRCKHHNHGE